MSEGHRKRQAPLLTRTVVSIAGVLLLLSPALLAVQLNESDFLLGPSLLLLLYVTIHNITLKQLSIACVIIGAHLLHRANYGDVAFISTGYYSAAAILITTRWKLRQDEIDFLITIASTYLIACSVADLINTDLIDAVVAFPRRHENAVGGQNPEALTRIQFALARPVGFYRESSEFGLTVTAVYYGWLRYCSQRFRWRVILPAILSFSFTAYVGIILVTAISGRIQLRTILISIASLFVVYHSRLLEIAQLTEISITNLVFINTSEIKRIVHPLIGMLEVLHTANLGEIIFGVGAGTYKETLQIAFAALEFSDLKEGFILNGAFNMFLAFGAFGYIILCAYIIRSRSIRHLIIVHLFLMQGSPILSPVYLLCSIDKAPESEGNFVNRNGDVAIYG